MCLNGPRHPECPIAWHRRYPWPAVAKRAADAMVKLERTDLIPQLLDALEAADPRLPATKEEGARKVVTVRELVKVKLSRL